MIAPDPALAGPRPVTPARAEARSADRDAAAPEHGGDEDFETVLAGKPQRKAEPKGKEAGPEAPAEASAGEAQAVPAAPVAPEASLVPVLAVPAAVVPERLAEASVAAVSAAAAEMAPDLPKAAATAPQPEAVPAGPEEMSADQVTVDEPRPGPRVARVSADQSVTSGAAAVVTVEKVMAPARPVAAGVAEALQAARAAKLEAEPEAEAPEARRAMAAAPTAAPAGAAAATAPAAAGTTGDAAAPAVVVHRSDAPPAWQLTPETGATAQRPEAAAPLPQPVQPQAVIGQLAVAVGRTSDRRVEIRLDPPELGRVQIHLTPVGGGVQAVVLADRPETGDLLRRHAEALARELGAAGYDNVDLSFATGGDTPAGRDAPRSAEWAQAAVLPAAPEGAPAPAAPRRATAAGLDVRL